MGPMLQPRPAEPGLPAAPCPVCGDASHRDALIVCSRCGASHHLQCWRYTQGCSTYGCGGRTFESPPAPGEPLAPLVVDTASGEAGGAQALAQTAFVVLLGALLGKAATAWGLFAEAGLLVYVVALAAIVAVLFGPSLLRHRYVFDPASRTVRRCLTFAGRRLSADRPVATGEEIAAVRVDREPAGPSLAKHTVVLQLRSGRDLVVRRSRLLLTPADEMEVRSLAERMGRFAGVPVVGPRLAPAEPGAEASSAPAALPAVGERFSFDQALTGVNAVPFVARSILAFGVLVGFLAGAALLLAGVLPVEGLAESVAVTLAATVLLAGAARPLWRHRLTVDPDGRFIARGLRVLGLGLGPGAPWVRLPEVSAVHLNRMRDGRGTVERLRLRLRDGTWRHLAISQEQDRCPLPLDALAERLARLAGTTVTCTEGPAAMFADHVDWRPDPVPPAERPPAPPAKDGKTGGETACARCGVAAPTREAVVCHGCGGSHHAACWDAGPGCARCGGVLGLWPEGTDLGPGLRFATLQPLDPRLLPAVLALATLLVAAGICAAAAWSLAFLVPTALLPFAAGFAWTAWFRLAFDPATRTVERQLMVLDRPWGPGEPRWLDATAVAEVYLEERRHALFGASRRLWVVLTDGTRRDLSEQTLVPGQEGATEWLAERVAAVAGTTVRRLREGEAPTAEELRGATEQKLLDDRAGKA